MALKLVASCPSHQNGYELWSMVHGLSTMDHGLWSMDYRLFPLLSLQNEVFNCWTWQYWR